MEKIYCGISYIPIRKEPSHRSEQVSQLIYGESAETIDNEKNWLFIKSKFDNFEGWVEKKIVALNNGTNRVKTTTMSQIIYSKSGKKIFIPHGAEISYQNKKSCILVDGESFNFEDEVFAKRTASELASDFLGFPYLWGGRTMFGIDCSGLSQIVMKCLDIQLPRNASQQVNYGVEVPFHELSRPGDLAFFENEESQITHVGIIINNKEIIHASGSVRKDKIDQQGIFNERNQVYTHKLRVIKRLSESGQRKQSSL